MSVKARRAAGFAVPVVAAVLVLTGCRSGHNDGWSSRARTMFLASGPTEIDYASSKVPGYLAVLAGGGDVFFLYTRDRSFEKGDWITVEGPFGVAYPAVFREETGVYLKTTFPVPIQILVVWKIGKADRPAGEPPEILARDRPRGERIALVSDAAFVRTNRGDYVDGYLAVRERDFLKQRLFLVLRIPRYRKGDRLDVVGELTRDSVLLSVGGGAPERIPVFEVEQARPDVSAAPAIPAIK